MRNTVRKRRREYTVTYRNFEGKRISKTFSYLKDARKEAHKHIGSDVEITNINGTLIAL